MRNNKQRTKIGCTIRPFDCANYKHEHFCNLYETDCEYAKKLNIHDVITCSECGNPFQRKEIIIQGDIDTCDDCLCPE